MSSSAVLLYAVNDELPDDQSTFRVFLINAGEAPINFGPADVWIELPEGERVDMIAASELEGRHRRDVERRRALAVIGGAMSGASANGHQTGTTTFRGTTSSGSTFSGSGTYSSYDPNLAQKQQQQVANQTANVMGAIRARQLGGLDALNNLLRQNTVQPQQVIGGTVAYDPPRALRRLPDSTPLVIVVRVGTDEHRVSATVSEIR